MPNAYMADLPAALSRPSTPTIRRMTSDVTLRIADYWCPDRSGDPDLDFAAGETTAKECMEDGIGDRLMLSAIFATMIEKAMVGDSRPASPVRSLASHCSGQGLSTSTNTRG